MKNMHIKLKFKFIPVVLFLLLLNFKSKAQEDKNYLIYYDLINKAEMLAFEKKHELALEKYKEAFKQFGGFEEDYTTAIKFALTQTNPKITFRLLKEKAIKTGRFEPESLFDKVQYSRFLKTSFGKKFYKNKEKWFKENLESRNYMAVYLSNTIDATDQFVRNWYLKSSKQNFKNDSLMESTYSNVIEETDNKNFKRFKQFVKENGFPGRRMFGGKEQFETFIKHIFKYKKDSLFENDFEKTKFLFLDSILRIQVLNGNYNNKNFAYCYDYSLSPDSVSYYAYPRFYRKESGERVLINYPVIDPENLNKRRSEIGLMSIEDQCKILNAPLPPNYKRKND